jgi:uncharacterized protein YdiU (UPF0061 family)
VADYLIDHHFPEIASAHPAGASARYEALLREVCVRTARLAAHWQAVGFVHGVLNTDNTSPLGITIDYGPYGWLEKFDPGAYRRGNQSGGLLVSFLLNICCIPPFPYPSPVYPDRLDPQYH